MIERYGLFFTTLTPDFKNEDFYAVFAPTAYFRDPFQEVEGVDAIIEIFRHMYVTLKNPRFEILDSFGDNERGVIRWRFSYDGGDFKGLSHVLFDQEQRVISHIDYWDAASNVYEKIPMLGSVLRFIKRRLRAPS